MLGKAAVVGASCVDSTRILRSVFDVDGSSFASATEKNPTLTILSLSWCATDYLADQMKQGVL